MVISPQRSALIDVLLPVFNAQTTIEQAIQSIQRQTITNIRIIVVNDGSTDGTRSILSRLVQEDRRILVLDQPNSGIVDALNAGLEACEAEFVARQDADDISFPERLKRELDHLLHHPGCVAVSGNVHEIDQNGVRRGNTSHFPLIAVGDSTYIPAREPFLMHPFLMARREAIEQIGGYRYVFHAEDADLYWRLSSYGSLENLGLLGEYRIHAGSVTSRTVTNGRVGAVQSQLAAISHQRRLSNRHDIHFEKSMLIRYEEARSLEAIVSLASAQLDEHESAFLALGSAAKLLTLAQYRPYTLEIADLRYAREVFGKYLGIANPLNRKSLCSLYVAAMAKQAKDRRFRPFFSMASLAIVAEWASEKVAQRLLSQQPDSRGRNEYR